MDDVLDLVLCCVKVMLLEADIYRLELPDGLCRFREIGRRLGRSRKPLTFRQYIQ
jgi:hypothetical protein